MSSPNPWHFTFQSIIGTVYKHTITPFHYIKLCCILYYIYDIFINFCFIIPYYNLYDIIYIYQVKVPSMAAVRKSIFFLGLSYVCSRFVFIISIFCAKSVFVFPLLFPKLAFGLYKILLISFLLPDSHKRLWVGLSKVSGKAACV